MISNQNGCDITILLAVINNEIQIITIAVNIGFGLFIQNLREFLSVFELLRVFLESEGLREKVFE
jgi:hypothetical protein